MKFSFKLPAYSQSLLIFFIGAFSMLAGFRYSDVDAQNLVDKAAVLATAVWEEQFPVSIENNSVLAVCRNVSQAENPIEYCQNLSSLSKSSEFSCKSEKPVNVAKKINVIATAYSSTPWQTDSTPYITADGATVRDGIIANNMLTFGTQVRIPELYGDKVFTVEDRMSWRKSNYQIDIWFPSLQQAVNFGAKSTYIEVLN
jgi:3D (Asp-Asp-Asp) domain-containing protein